MEYWCSSSKEYYEALSCDLKGAKKSVTIVSPFITEGRIDRIEPLLIQAMQRSNGKLIVEIITSPQKGCLIDIETILSEVRI